LPFKICRICLRRKAFEKKEIENKLIIFYLSFILLYHIIVIFAKTISPGASRILCVSHEFYSGQTNGNAFAPVVTRSYRIRLIRRAGTYRKYVQSDGRLENGTRKNRRETRQSERVAWQHLSMGLTHCPICLVLDKCRFQHVEHIKMPELPQHEKCHCVVKQIATPIAGKTAIAKCPIEKFTEYIFADKYAWNGKRGCGIINRNFVALFFAATFWLNSVFCAF
jgi:hypothetical protein